MIDATALAYQLAHYCELGCMTFDDVLMSFENVADLVADILHPL